MKIAITAVAAALFVSIVRATAASETGATASVAPRFLSDTGLYSDVAKLKGVAEPTDPSRHSSVRSQTSGSRS